MLFIPSFSLLTSGGGVNKDSPAPVKYAFSLMKRCSPSIRLPLVEVENYTKQKIKSALKKLKII